MDSDWRNDVIENIESLSTINLYEILEIEKCDDAALIKKQYRKLALKYHPDKGGNDTEKFELVNLAYHILSDDELRSKYDEAFEGYTDFATLKNSAFHTVKDATSADQKKFDFLVEQLNKKHGYNPEEFWKPEEIFRRKLNLESERSNFEKQLQEAPKISHTDFTRKFEEGRMVDGEPTTELVAYEGGGALSNCVFLKDFEQLYDTQGNLEEKFQLPTLGRYVEDNTPLPTRMKMYEEEGKKLTDQVKRTKQSSV